MTIEFSDEVLQPRPWTLEQARWAAELADTAPDGRIVELCCGVGQIGLAFGRMCVDRGRPRDLVLVDADTQACGFARANAARTALGTDVEVRESLVQKAFRPDETFSVMVADPPWVPSGSTGRYPEDPLWAIDGGPDGLDIARSCLASVARHLQPGGSAVLQLGTDAQINALIPELDETLEVAERRSIPGANGILVRLVLRPPADQGPHSWQAPEAGPPGDNRSRPIGPSTFDDEEADTTCTDH
ncbi:methyltransferase [Microlunatus elymi]|uniref:methyltransferase n=1 Tax=Microlunatus elymi TaxID=2596828 RepID=UPI001D18D968|nr:class I SAM-dependent methyltransferase [Microlunatus elymi]